jgi:plastocyanin
MSKLSLILSCSVALVSFGACSSDDSGDDDDDAPGGAVTEVDCSTAASAPVVANAGLSYSPASTTIAANGVVKFTLGATHDVASSTSGLSVGLGGTKCLKFPTAGTYQFHCTPHGFTGTIVVQ